MDKLSTAKAHRHFAAEAFNRCWEIMHLQERAPDETREMIRLAEASFWHWQHASGRKPNNDAVGYWQLSRVYAMAGDASTAIEYAQRGIETARKHKLNDFHLGYAWESAARGYFLAGMTNLGVEALAKAKKAASRVTDPANKAALEMDLLGLHPVVETEGSAIA
ncbi:hypothetical protein [Cerasicoccus fimbriatus]|uniref:hypothetical protein n=1 Tax=Cerasicoccus fimbriatus TaxID=3014554 RepID=UPI0022B50339|nr:hypothetical protein [Cerasicoccus sp. TK19100]